MLCSIGAGPHTELLELTRPSFEALAERHAYDLQLYTTAPAARHPAWHKLTIALDMFEIYERVLWIDADCVVVDPSRDFAACVDRRRPWALVAHNYHGQTVPNLGVFAIKRSRAVIGMLQAMWSMTQYLDHKWWENAAFLDLLGYDINSEPIRKVRRSRYDRRIRWLGNEWNSIDLDPATRPIIKHYPGMTQADRLARMRADIDSLAAVGTI